MRRAKIICTVGPSIYSQEALERLMANGMDVARLNFSHGAHESHAQVIEWLRAASLRVRKAVAIVADLQGPKIRTGKNKDGKPVMLETGAELEITTDESVLGEPGRVSTTYQYLAEDVNVGDRILLDDGLLELKVLSTDKARRIVTKVVVGGPLGQNKGINLPGVSLRTPALTDKDKTDLEFALKAGVDYVALSFVRRPEDIDLARQCMERAGRMVPIIAKLEKPEAIENLDPILARTDGVMVARGDLGVEMNPEEVPVIQKEIIKRCNQRGLPVIIATQMLNSMIDNPRPTRAEASDVANAIFDGADAVMMSGETASGKYPFESLAMMDRIVRTAEAQLAKERPKAPPEPTTYPAGFPEVTCGIACRAAREAGAALIAAFTLSGTTARLLSRYRPSVPVVAFSPNQEVRRRLGLLWGVVPRIMEPVAETEPMVKRVEEELLSRGLAQRGDRVVIVFGAPISVAGKINSIRLHQIPL
ncbi:MAG: pyruvate kinase [Myxococcales bacterium]